MSCVTFCSIRFTFDLHIYLMPKNSQFHNNQPRTGIFFKGLLGPRSKQSLSVSTLAMFEPFFKNNPFPTMPCLEPLKIHPPLSISTLAMFEPFFKYNPFPIALFVAFCAKADPTPDSAPVANVGRTSLLKMAGLLQPNQPTSQATHLLLLYCEQPDVYSFLL